MIKVKLIRHGKTNGNIRKAYIGSTDEDLSEEYITKVKSRRYADAELVFSSPMKRCIQTAKLIYPNNEIHICEDLRECSFGDFEGKTYDELNGNTDYQAWLDSGGAAAFPNGEKPSDFKHRCITGFMSICEYVVANRNKTVDIVCHGGTIMSILEHISNPRYDFYHWQVDNLSGYSFTYDEISKQAGCIIKL